MRALTGADVHVWHGCVDVTGDVPPEPRGSDLAILSADERTRCQRFVRQADRVRFAMTHAAQRRVLARYLEIDPAEIQFGRTPCCECGSVQHGPPRIDRPVTDITVNLSGSGDHWLLAITRARPVGADIEVPRDIDTGQLARACLTPQEQQDLGRQPGAARQQIFFYRCWTRKEAVLKACGIGLPGSMRGLEAVPGRIGPVEVRHCCQAGPDRWLVQDLTGIPGPAQAPAWLGAVAQPAAEAGAVWFCEAGVLAG